MKVNPGDSRKRSVSILSPASDVVAPHRFVSKSLFDLSGYRGHQDELLVRHSALFQPHAQVLRLEHHWREQHFSIKVGDVAQGFADGLVEDEVRPEGHDRRLEVRVPVSGHHPGPLGVIGLQEVLLDQVCYEMSVARLIVIILLALSQCSLAQLRLALSVSFLH